MVSDVLAEEQLGEISKPVPPLDPEERVEVEALIRTSRVSEQVLISVVADVDDLSALNNELWFMTKDDLRELEEERTAVDHPDVETVEFVADPKLWLSADDEI
jgi:hypothetical protein